MQFLPLSEPHEVARIDRHDDAVFIDGAAPYDVIRLAHETAITHMISIVASLRKRANVRWRDVLVEQQSQAFATLDFGRPTSG